jgi:hypothetical protein
MSADRARIVVTQSVIAMAALAVGLVAPATAGAARPAADCQPFAGRPCLFPFPSNLFTRPDPTSRTGVRVKLPATAMPVNTKGARVRTGPYNRDDGFSPGSDLVVHVPGLATAAAFHKTNPVQLLDMARTSAKRGPIVVIDEATGARQLIWSELDANATSPANTDLIIHPGKNFTEGHTYIAVLRDLKNAGGRVIKAPAWFARLRDGRPLPPAERSQKRRYGAIFAALAKAGIGLKNVYEAWNFTIASPRDRTGRMLAIRNAAFAQLGDHNLADSTVQGRAPVFQISSTATLSPTVRTVNGTYQVPCYLVVCGDSAVGGFHYSSTKPDALPTQIPGNVATAEFECIVPSSASPSNPARISLYGHGLLGSYTEIEDGPVTAMATEHNIVFCATYWWGLAEKDTLNDAAAIGNINLFPPVVDRLQQGVLNTLFLGRLMLNPAGLATNAAFQSGGHPVIDTSHLYYDGNSQGGIMGGMTTAVAPDFRHAVLGVTGMNYANILVQRSTDFAPFGTILYGAYPDQSSHPLILDLMQQLWDRGDPDGYAQQMTSHPLPDTPSHQVLMQIAYGDHQVSMYAAAVEARTIGASAYEPALDLATNRRRDRNLFYGIPAIAAFPFRGSAIEVWDSGAGRVQPPPVGNIAPVDNTTTNIDPHPDPRNTPLARVQKSDFLEPNGVIVNVCAGRPCRTSVYTP